MTKKGLMTGLLVVAGLVGIQAASAAVVEYSGTNVGGDPVPLSLTGTSYGHIQAFMVSEDGVYRMEVIQGNFDTVLYLFPGYGMSQHWLVMNDDGGAGLLSLLYWDLVADTVYTLVTAGFGFSTGTFTNEIDGPGMITLLSYPPSAVPEPSTAALMALSLVGMGFASRRRARSERR